MCTSCRTLGGSRQRQSGISLIELILFVIIFSLVLASILPVMNFGVMHSADTLMRKQALTVADSLLEEIESRPFSGTSCGALGANALRARLCIVSDYNGYSTTSGILSYTNAAVAGLGSYNVSSVQVTAAALAGIPSSSAVLITVTVAEPNGQTVMSTGYRTAYK